MKKMKPVKILNVVFASLLCLLIVAYETATLYSSAINRALGVSGSDLYEVIEDGGSDTDYFPTDYDGNDEASIAALSQYADALTAQAEGEGLVLLKNDNGALPLQKGDQVSCFLYGSYKLNYSASGSGEAATDGYPSLETALEASGFGVNPAMNDFYESLPTGLSNGYGRMKRTVGLTQRETYFVREAPWSLYGDVLDSFEAYGDAAIAVIARDSGEGSVDLSVQGSDGENGNYLAITPEEEEILRELTKRKEDGTFKKIIVLLNSSAPMELDFLYRDGIDVDACLWIGNLGRTGVYAVADVLAGEIIPSGRASDTFCRDNLSSPAMASWSLNSDGAFAQIYGDSGAYGLNTTQQNYGVYVEGIYVGYRYYETRYEDYVLGQGNAGDFDYGEVVAYPFGYGLSYTAFSYSDLTVADNGDSLDVTVSVTNTGSYSGKEVIQIYLQKPYDPSDGVEKASVELVGFDKVEIAAGATETVTVTVSKEQFKSYDADGNETYILSKGDYYLTAAKNAHDAVNNILAAKGMTPENSDGRMDAEGDGTLAKVVWTNQALDAVTYASSTETGQLITNQLSFADINKYENRGDNAVTYVSRADWTGTWPTKPISLCVSGEAMRADMESNKAIADDPEAESPVYGKDNGMTLSMLRELDYDDEAWDSLLDQMTFEEQAAFLTSAGFGTDVIESIMNPPTVDDDGPTGVTTNSRTGASYPSEGIWASTFNLALIEEIGEMFAEDARAAGNTSMYAPGLNIHRTPYGGRSHEYFSEDPFLSGMAAAAEVTGMQSRGIIPTLKHFAFNDQESQRNGIGIWLNEQAAREIYLTPFEYAMRPSMGNAHGIMTSFNRAGTVWTSASSGLMVNIARGEWGFDGYSITDMVSGNGALYMTYPDGIMNGTELYLDASSGSTLSEYAGNSTVQVRVREAVKRVLYVICNYSAAMNGAKIYKSIMPWWQTALMAALAVASVVTAVTLTLWIVYLIKSRKRR